MLFIVKKNKYKQCKNNSKNESVEGLLVIFPNYNLIIHSLKTILNKLIRDLNHFG